MRVRGAALFQDTCSPVTEKPASAVPERPLASDQPAPRRNEQGFPDPQTCIEWIARFFDTVGVVLPYVSEAPLLREVNKMGTSLGYDTPQSRPTKALLNVVFAHALSTLDQGSPEPFYHRALGLLLVNEQTVGSWNLETSPFNATLPGLVLIRNSSSTASAGELSTKHATGHDQSIVSFPRSQGLVPARSSFAVIIRTSWRTRKRASGQDLVRCGEPR